MASSHSELPYTTPGLDRAQAERTVTLLQSRLHAMNDLHLTLKHVHWNVVGPHFIAVHEMIDPQVDTVRGFADDLAERIATLGGSPRAHQAPSSPSGTGTTTRSAGPRRRRTSALSTWSTGASSAPTAR